MTNENKKRWWEESFDERFNKPVDRKWVEQLRNPHIYLDNTDIKAFISSIEDAKEREVWGKIKGIETILAMAKCPVEDCDGNGNIPVLVTGVRQISETECEQTQEWEAEQCQWCYERDMFVSQFTKLANEK
jgi:hypothetical protein